MHHINIEGRYRYLETSGQGETVVLLHGLFGALSNFEQIIERMGSKYRVVVPLLPIYDLPLKETSIRGLLRYITDFIKYKDYKDIHIMGNSLGGHIALMYALSKQSGIRSLILTGSSGLFENAFGKSFPKRSNYEFIKKKTESTFYDPKVATKDLVDEVYKTVNDRNKGLRIVMTAKSAVRSNLEKNLHRIKVPTLLVWGKNDKITPLFVGKRFNQLIKNSKLVSFEKCGHAPMMEKPNLFTKVMAEFIDQVSVKKSSKDFSEHWS